MKKIAVIGGGLIGRNLAIRLKKFNFKVHVFTRNINKILDLKSLDIIVDSNLSDSVYNADIVVLCLPSSEAITEVCFSNLFLEAKPKSVIDMGTTSPTLTLDLYDYFRKNNIKFFDAPFSGGPKDVLEGKIVSLLGCKTDVYNEFKYFFDIFSQKVFVLNTIGLAQKVKIALNIIKAGIYQVYVEGLILGVKQGVDINLMLDIINNSSAASSISKSKLFKAINNPELSFSFKNMKKDVLLGLEEISKLNLDLPILSNLKEFYMNQDYDLNIDNVDYTNVILNLSLKKNNLKFLVTKS